MQMFWFTGVNRPSPTAEIPSTYSCALVAPIAQAADDITGQAVALIGDLEPGVQLSEYVNLWPFVEPSSAPAYVDVEPINSMLPPMNT